ncbi:MAG: RNA 3'-terminal phosphate cyclase, partial [Thermoplasmata archaeon]
RQQCLFCRRVREVAQEAPRAVILVDGAHGEGGGQIVRASVALAALTRQPCRIENIRAGRQSPGLAAQHVAAVRAIAALSSAEVDGLKVGSRAIVFRPGDLKAGHHAVDVGTAGSLNLVLQACLPVALAAPSAVRLTLTGGTDVPWSPPHDYVARVFLPLLRRCGAQVDVMLLRRGYYPRGGGIVEVTILPEARAEPFHTEGPGGLRAIRGIAHASNLPEDIPKRMKHAAMRRLHGRGDVKIEERVYSGDEAVGQGGALVLWAETEGTILGADSLAARGKASERIGEEAASDLAAELDAGSSLDVHAADQLLPYLVQASDASEFRVREVSGHLRTMAWLVQRFTGREVSIGAHAGLWRVEVAETAR